MSDEALLRQSEVANLQRPSSRVVEAFRVWFSEPRPVLGGRAKTILDDRQDLVALKTPAEHDFLSRFLRKHWPATKRDGAANVHCIGRFSEGSVIVTVAIISTFVAAVLLVGAIVSLYNVEKESARLGLIGGFTALFALSVAVLTNAKREQIFAATAAYAAVLVVFISGDFGQSNDAPRRVPAG